MLRPKAVFHVQQQHMEDPPPELLEKRIPQNLVYVFYPCTCRSTNDDVLALGSNRFGKISLVSISLQGHLAWYFLGF
jgi:hypothetical protein